MDIYSCFKTCVYFLVHHWVQHTKCLISRAMAVHVHYKSMYICLLLSTQQHCEMTKFYVFWRTQMTASIFYVFIWVLNTGITCIYFNQLEQFSRPIGTLNRSRQLQNLKVEYKWIHFGPQGHCRHCLSSLVTCTQPIGGMLIPAFSVRCMGNIFQQVISWHAI